MGPSVRMYGRTIRGAKWSKLCQRIHKTVPAGEYIDVNDPVAVKEIQPRLKSIVNDLGWALDGLEANVIYLEINAAILNTLIICEPARFIVEQSEMGLKKPKGNLIRRSRYRKHYIALTPGEIKRRYLYDEHETEHIPRAPHERRGHWRKYTSDRYVNIKGQKKWINTYWVGKTEGVRGKNKYVVRLDL